MVLEPMEPCKKPVQKGHPELAFYRNAILQIDKANNRLNNVHVECREDTRYDKQKSVQNYFVIVPTKNKNRGKWEQ